MFLTQLAIKWPFSFPPHPTSAFALPGKTEQTKCALKSTKNLLKFYISRCVATNSQSITRFDCCVTARLLNRPNIQEYWWIQEATGEVWIGLEQSVIDDAIDEWRKCLWVELMFVGQNFKHFCGQLKNGQLDKLSAETMKIWTKCVFCVQFWLSNNTKVVKNAIFYSFSFPG